MDKRICNDCQKIFYTDSVVCPKCGSSNISVIEEESVKKEGDLSFRVEKIPSTGLKCFDKDLLRNGNTMIAGIVMIFLLPLFGVPIFLINWAEYKDAFFKSFVVPSIAVGVLLAIFGLLMFIVSFRDNRLIKHLLKNGVILKNIPFTIVSRSGIFSKVKIEYKDEHGNNHLFVGVLKDNYNELICDVLVDPNNYKKYIVMDDIK